MFVIPTTLFIPSEAKNLVSATSGSSLCGHSLLLRRNRRPDRLVHLAISSATAQIAA
jgi:hypothetical protein